MFFQSNKKKKRLWRARVRQPATTLIQLAASTQQALAVAAAAAAAAATSAAQTQLISNNLIMSAHSLSNHQQQQQQQQQEQSMDMITNQQQYLEETSSTCPMIQHHSSAMSINNLMNYSGDRSDSSSMIDGQENFTSGYYYENSVESATDYEEDQTMSTTVSSTTAPSPPSLMPSSITTSSLANLVRKTTSKRRTVATAPSQSAASTTAYTPMIKQKQSLIPPCKDALNYHKLIKFRNQATTTTTTSNTSSMVCDLVRNCCGGGNSCSTDSIDCSQMYNNNNNYKNMAKLSTYAPMETKFQKNQQIVVAADEQLKQLFQALMGKVKEPQLTTLVQAVDSLQKNATTNCGANNSTSTILTTSSSRSLGHQPDCVLVPRTLIRGLPPNLIACLIWRWPDLRSSDELKSIASCRNEKDPIYACCNPSHWSRLLIPETPPPPYQQHTTERLKSEDHASNEITREEENYTNDSFVDPKRDLRIQFPGSLTTENEDPSILASSWCELAYWEYKQRVGGRFPVENSSVNIFFDQYRGDGMCLKTLADQAQTATPDQVLKVRQKIGLGVTLSQEADGVWLYNHSSSPVFVHSPTLNSIDYWFHATKVPPDHCLKAYDSYKAKTQNVKWPSQITGAQTGPIDTHSMRISFAKGWGPKYTRQDITACPCWLEVLLRR